MQSQYHGFTLIELLVVIAIIGVISSIVLSSLNEARNKGNDAAIKQQLNQMRPAAEIIFDATGTYNSVCDLNNSTTGKMFKAAYANSNHIASSLQCVSSGAEYYSAPAGSLTVTIKPLTPGKWRASMLLWSNHYFCVDYAGNATTTDSPPTNPAILTCQ